MSPEKSDRESRKRRWKRAAVGLLTLLLLFFVADYYAYPWGRPINAPLADKGTNGLWVRYTYYFGEASGSDIETLAKRLQSERIRYAYCHVRFIKKDGSLAFHYQQNARSLLDALRKGAPHTKLIAWVYAGNEQGAGEVDLANEGVRKKMAAESDWLVQDCGFDGVQWDYEACSDGDVGLLELLDMTRAALPVGSFVGVCAPVSYPGPINYGWSADYIAKVASRCDQIAVMCYDTGFFAPRSYVWLARKQVSTFASAVSQGKMGATFILGVPTYEEGTPSHNPRAENLSLALRAARQGAQTADHPANFEGVSVFANYTTSDDEWRTFERAWLGRSD